MALLALGGLTAVCVVAFIRSEQPINKLATALMWTISAVYFFGVA